MRKSQLDLLSHQNENLSTEVAQLRKELRTFGEAFVILSDSLDAEFESIRKLVTPAEIVVSDVGTLTAAQVKAAAPKRAYVRKAAPKT